MKSSKVVNIALIACLLGGVSACSSDKKDSDKGSGNHTNSSVNASNSNDKNNNSPSADSGKFDVNAESLSYSKYQFASNATSLAPIRTDPIWAGKGLYVASSKNIIVTNDNGVYYGLDFGSGKQLWKIDSSGKDIAGVKDIKDPNISVHDVGDKLLIVWSGQVGGDALNAAKSKSYAKSYSIDTGKVLQEKQFDTQIQVRDFGTGYKLDNNTYNNDNNTVFFADSGFIQDTKFNSFIEYAKNKYNGYGANNYTLSNYEPIRLNSKYASFVITTYKNNDKFLQIFDIANKKEVTGLIKIPNINNGDNIATKSPNLNYLIADGILVNINDPEKSHAVIDSNANIEYLIVNDDGEALGTASETGPKKWVMIKDRKATILDEYNSNNDGEDYGDFNSKYIVHSSHPTYTATDNQGTWNGNLVVFERKNNE